MNGQKSLIYVQDASEIYNYGYLHQITIIICEELFKKRTNESNNILPIFWISVFAMDVLKI